MFNVPIWIVSTVVAAYRCQALDIVTKVVGKIARMAGSNRKDSDLGEARWCL